MKLITTSTSSTVSTTECKKVGKFVEIFDLCCSFPKINILYLVYVASNIQTAVDASHVGENGLRLVWPEEQAEEHPQHKRLICDIR